MGWLGLPIVTVFPFSERRLLDHAMQSTDPDALAPLDALAERLLGFGEHYRQIARSFEWTGNPPPVPM